MNAKRKIILSYVVMVMILALVGVFAYNWYNNNYYVTTDDARLAADFVTVIPQTSGPLLDFTVNQGDTVVKNQIIGHIGANVAAGSKAVSVSNIVAPISGTIVERTATVGNFESSSQAPTLALIMDPNQIYISANIEETELEKVKIGQQVDINIDQFSNETFEGTVESIGQATNSEFSLLPSSSGAFTKVVQTIPIKISMQGTDMNPIPGASAEIKIHVK